jgi:YgiT-type zinc finger domain-containing protein
MDNTMRPTDPASCPLCGGRQESGTTTFTAELGFGVVVIRNVPARICQQCGEAWIDDAVAEALERRVNDARVQRQQVAVFAM